MKRAFAMVAAMLCVAAAPASAHHSLTPYIQTTAGVVIGTVKEFAWTNPHTRLIVLVPGADGTAVEWDFEGVSTTRLAQAGFKKETVAPGDMVSVVYYPRRDGSNGGLFVAVTLSDGKTFKLDRYQQLRGGGQRYE